MSTTRITSPDSERVLVETFDFRSEFSFDDFCEWVSDALKISLSPKEPSDELSPRLFDFEGERFRVAWEDEFGSYIEGSQTQRAVMERFQATLSGEP